MKNIAIIYHDADFDGKLSNEVCRYWLLKLNLGATIDSYGWDYGRPVPTPSWEINTPHSHNGGLMTRLAEWADYDVIYIVDLSVDELMAQLELREKIVWIDHHKSAIEKHDAEGDPWTGRKFSGLRIDGVAACRLCWQWFLRGEEGYADNTLSKQLFTDRLVDEPELLRLAGEYDVWDHRDPDAKALQFGLRALSEEELLVLIESEFASYGTAPLQAAVSRGYSIKSYCDKQNNEYSAAYARTLQWEGLTFCALNLGQRGNSDLLRGGLKPEHQAGFAWRHTGDSVMVSLYHVPGHEHLDLSEIAKRYGGGGHRGACGFRISLRQLADILGE